MNRLTGKVSGWTVSKAELMHLLKWTLKQKYNGARRLQLGYCFTDRFLKTFLVNMTCRMAVKKTKTLLYIPQAMKEVAARNNVLFV